MRSKSSSSASQSVRRFPTVRFANQTSKPYDDLVAVEEPLETRIEFGPLGSRRSKSLAVTMRTPGHDAELAVGFLRAENIIQNGNQIAKIQDVGPAMDDGQRGSTMFIELTPDVSFSTEQLQRHFYLTASCGVCGKASIESVMQQGFGRPAETVIISADTIAGLPEILRAQQVAFEQTGGIHAAGLFDGAGQLQLIREDVGRHNAVDKLVGNLMLAPNPDTDSGKILVVSSRASFELVQKALAASFEMLVAVGAPSSLAIELADAFGLTLIGFASAKRFNVYCGAERVRFQANSSA